MNQSSNILEDLRALPEQKRKLIAYGFLLLMGLLIFSLWIKFLSPDIPSLGASASGDTGQYAQSPASTQKPLTPAAGIIESFKGLGALFGPKK